MIESQKNCYQFGLMRDEQGEIVLRDIFLPRNGTIYAITVATPDALTQIKRQNELFSDPDEKRNENIYVDEEIIDLGKLCRKLTSEIPFEELQPYLREQKRETEEI